VFDSRLGEAARMRRGLALYADKVLFREPAARQRAAGRIFRCPRYWRYKKL